MLRQLWIHRCVEILQGQIQQHVNNPSRVSGEAIRMSWKRIQTDMAEVFVEMEHDAFDTVRRKQLYSIQQAIENNAVQDKKGPRS